MNSKTLHFLSYRGFLSGYRKQTSIDNAKYYQKTPNPSTQLLHECLPFHQRRASEVNHGHIAMNANEREEDHTATEVDAEHGNLQLADESPKNPVIHGKVHCHQWGEWCNDGIR